MQKKNLLYIPLMYYQNGNFKIYSKLFTLTIFFILSVNCSTDRAESENPNDTISEYEAGLNIFDRFLHTEFEPADGFDFPIGNADGKGVYTDKATGKNHDGWYIATQFAEQYDLGIHPGEDWNGRGGGNTDLGQDVFAVANGRVAFAEHCGRLWGNVVIIEHIFCTRQGREHD
jgi:murein DD-endopeptidase MepM/ murein hydrolase activator NlpD